MVRKFYDYEIDKAICEALLKHDNNISIRKLKWIVESKEYLGRTIPIKIFQYHIQKLLNAEFIFYKEEERERGKKLPLFLSSKTREQLRLGNLNIEFKEREHPGLLNSYKKLKRHQKTKEDRFKSEFKRNRIYYIVVRVLSIKTPNRHYRYPGLSITDITNARYDGHAFYTLRLEDDKEMIQKCLNNLNREKIVSEIKISLEDESRYKLVGLRWKSFVTECAQLLEDSVMMYLHLKWTNLRPCSPQERIWYESCWGDRDANGHLNSVYQHYTRNQEKSNVQYKKQILDIIKLLDYNIHKRYKELESKYSDLAERCTSVYNMIIETIYPEFLRLEIERKLHSPKNRDTKYLKLQSAHFDDSLTFDDCVQSMTYKIDKKPE